MSEWGSFIDETPSGQSPPPPPDHPPSGAGVVDDGWGSFADEAPATGGAPPPPPSVPPATPRPYGVPVPSPEVAASLLTAGETLWAQVDGAQAVLGSGCRVAVVRDDDGEAAADGFGGWRPVTVVDPAALTVRLVPLALAEPPVGTATPVAELYADPEPYTAVAPERAGVFPVGQGPDLDELLMLPGPSSVLHRLITAHGLPAATWSRAAALLAGGEPEERVLLRLWSRGSGAPTAATG